MNNFPIGIFDSGLGGLSVLSEIQKKLPKESIIYLADKKNCPLGNKTQKEIRDLTVSALRWLLNNHVKLIIIACNTVSTVGIEYYRKLFQNIEIVGVVPAVKSAVLATKNKSIGIYSTKTTSHSPYLKKLIATFCEGIKVTNLGSGKLAELIEKGILNGPKMNGELSKYMAIFQRNQIDTLVLGCTHYPLIADVIAKYFNYKVKLIDSGEAIARRVTSILIEKRMAKSRGVVTEKYFTTANPEKISEIASFFLRKSVHFDKIDL